MEHLDLSMEHPSNSFYHVDSQFVWGHSLAGNIDPLGQVFPYAFELPAVGRNTLCFLSPLRSVPVVTQAHWFGGGTGGRPPDLSYLQNIPRSVFHNFWHREFVSWCGAMILFPTKFFETFGDDSFDGGVIESSGFSPAVPYYSSCQYLACWKE